VADVASVEDVALAERFNAKIADVPRWNNIKN
jgi:hypothetical protein